MSERSLKPGWQVCRFDQIATSVNDRINDPSKADVEYYVGLEHLDSDSLKIRRWGTPSDVEATKLCFRKGDIIFGRRRVYQRKVAVADFDGICSAHALVLRPKPAVVDPGFLPFFMQSDLFMERAKAISVGSLSPTINWKTLAKENFALPPLEEQQRVALTLNAIWKFEESLLCVQEKLNLVASAAFEWAIGLRHFSESKNKSKLFGKVNSNWSEKSVGELCLLVTDGEHATPPRTEQGIPLISARNVLNGRIDLQEVDYISPETFELLAKRIRPITGDVLITCSGTIGRVSIVPKNMDFAMVRSVALIRPNPEKLDYQFLEIFLRSRLAARQIVALTQQTAQGNLFQSAIRRIQIPNLDLAKQKEIVANMISYQKALDLLVLRLSNCQNLRKHLLEYSIGKVII